MDKEAYCVFSDPGLIPFGEQMKISEKRLGLVRLKQKKRQNERKRERDKQRERKRERENVSESMGAIEMDKRDWEKTVSLRTFFIAKFIIMF